MPTPTGSVEWVLDASTAITSGDAGGDYVLAHVYDNDPDTAFSTSALSNGTLGIDLGSGIEAELTAFQITPIVSFEYRERAFSVQWSDTAAGTRTTVATTSDNWPFREPVNWQSVSAGIAKQCWHLLKSGEPLQCTGLRLQGTYAAGLNYLPAPPIFTPGAGRFAAGQSITIASPTTNAEIYYTANEGSEPADPDDGDTLYSGAISLPAITSGTTYYIKAVAKINSLFSSVTTAYFNPKEIVPDGGIPAWGGTQRWAQDWRDSDGNLIQAHGGDILYDPESGDFFWYGAYMTTNDACGIWAYNSSDIYNWSFAGQLAQQYTGTGGGFGFNSQTRYHPIYNASPSDPGQKYVIVAHGITTLTANYMLVAVSDSPDGPFTWLDAQQPDDGSPHDVWDCSLFQDVDDTWWFVAVTDSFANITAWELDATTDNTTFTGVGVEIGAGSREAPVLFFYNGWYFLLTSALMGYHQDNVRVQYRSAQTMAGLAAASDVTLWDFTPVANEVSYVAQPTAAIKLPGRTGVMLLLDQWIPGEPASPGDKYHARAVAIAIPDSAFSGGTITLGSEAFDPWILDEQLPAVGGYTRRMMISHGGKNIVVGFA